MTTCPCGSGATYAACCEPLITGAQPAKTAEALMRSRYSAYVGAQMEYLFETTHPKHRTGYDHEGARAWAESSTWEGLEIVSTTKGSEQDSEGEVEFIACYTEKGVPHRHHERASFKKDNGAWLFTDGTLVRPQPLKVVKIGRNDPCSCGSGKKYKKCCGA